MAQVPYNPDLPPQRKVEAPSTDIDLIQPGDIINPILDRPKPVNNAVNHTAYITIDNTTPYQDGFICCDPTIEPRLVSNDADAEDVELQQSSSSLSSSSISSSMSSSAGAQSSSNSSESSGELIEEDEEEAECTEWCVPPCCSVFALSLIHI